MSKKYMLGHMNKVCKMSPVVHSGKVQRADLTCDVIKKVAPFVLCKL